MNGQPIAAIAIRRRARRQCARRGEGREVAHGGTCPLLPQGSRLGRALRQLPLRGDFHHRGGEDPGRGHGAGVHRDVRVPRALAHHPDPRDGGAGGRWPAPCAGLYAFGFSINVLTLFAMVLAIGMLGGRRHRGGGKRGTHHGGGGSVAPGGHGQGHGSDHERPDRHRSCALGGVRPMAFFPGSTGVIYRQFSVTIIASMLLSVAVALILTPVLCASLLKPVPAGHEAENAIAFLRPFFRWFNHNFFSLRRLYVDLVGHSLTRKKRYLAVFLLIVAIMGVLYFRMPTAYLPDEDQGSLLSQIIMPAGATLEQTREVSNAG